MKRSVLLAVTSCALALAVVACARANTPDASTNAVTESPTDPRAADARDAQADGDAHFPGLPMPQKFPHVVWDAAGAR